MATKLKGGRKRKTAKKSASKRGGYYGFSGALGTGAPAWEKKEEVPVLAGGRRKSKKGSKKTRKAKRGGLRFGQAVAGYTGTGDRGLANYPDVSAPSGKAEFGSFGDNGAKPGDFSSFK